MSRLMLIDIDGVLTFEAEHAGGRELLRLHENLNDVFARFQADAVILTHRSRAEARHILASLGLTQGSISDIVAAEDLAIESIRSLQLFKLAKRGLLKSLILPFLERRYGVGRGDMCFIDDRMVNLSDLRDGGIGLAMHAPSLLSPDDVLTTFSFDEVQTHLDAWRSSPSPSTFISLSEVTGPVAEWRRTGASTIASGDHAFNRLRKLGNAARSRLRRR